jgi:hypothetical protein
LPSLKTIIELREQSEIDMKLQPLEVMRSRDGLFCTPVPSQGNIMLNTPGQKKNVTFKISLLSLDSEE